MHGCSGTNGAKQTPTRAADAVTGSRAGRRLAVWGDPVAHSRSPVVHAAAYARLGLHWAYDRRQVGADAFAETLGGLDESWRGISCTMPLKEAAFAAAVVRDRSAQLTGAANTLLLGEPGGIRGFNTDVGGIVRAFAGAGVSSIDCGRVIGAGATAASALVALSEMGARRVDVIARRPEQVAALQALAGRLGIALASASFDEPAVPVADVTVGTLPAGTDLALQLADPLALDGGVLLDAAYAPWPTALAAAFIRNGSTPISGLEMLLHQALLQVRLFVGGDPEAELLDEALVLADMRSALMKD